MPEGLKRIYGLGHLHFITFSCYRRLPLLRTARSRNIFVEVLREVRERYEFKLVGYVVMPEHVHLLIGEPSVAVVRGANAQAARFAASVKPRRWHRLLGKAFLRFQRMHVEEEGRKTFLRAHESGRARTCPASRRVDLEQLFLLPRKRGGPGSNRSRGLKPKTHPHKPRVGHPKHQNPEAEKGNGLTSKEVSYIKRQDSAAASM